MLEEHIFVITPKHDTKTILMSQNIISNFVSSRSYRQPIDKWLDVILHGKEL